jgi:hypothetical protein
MVAMTEYMHYVFFIGNTCTTVESEICSASLLHSTSHTLYNHLQISIWSVYHVT